jgi:hypothetical protein
LERYLGRSQFNGVDGPTRHLANNSHPAAAYNSADFTKKPKPIECETVTTQ